MTPTDVVRLVAIVTAISPAQKLDEFTADAWHPLLEDVSMCDALEAVKRVGRRQPFIAPSDIIAEVRSIRRVRLERADATFMPDMSPGAPEYIDQLRAHRKAIADGAEPPALPALTEAVPMSLLQRVFRRVPKAIEAKPKRLAPDPDAMQRARDEIAQLHKQPTSPQGDPNR